MRELNLGELGPLELAAEVAEVTGEISRVGRADLRLVLLEDATVLDITRALVEIPTDILHFSGHGERSGLVLAAGARSRFLTGQELSILLGASAQRTRLIVLNACWSDAQADALLQIADFVIGTGQAIDDEDARLFSRMLYFCLASGESLEQAFAAARVAAGGGGQPCLRVAPGAEASEPLFRRAERQAARDVYERSGDYEVVVLERAAAEERRLLEELSTALLIDVDDARRRLLDGRASLPKLGQRGAARRLRDLRSLGALVTSVSRLDTEELVRDLNGIWFGALPSRAAGRARLMLHPVTREQYAAYTGRKVPMPDRRLPQASITLAEARDFCDWLGARSKGRFRYRLPTRGEWLAAAEDQRELLRRDPAALRHMARVRADRTAPVGGFDPSRRGFLDLAGNVAEWTSTMVGNEQVVCGGSFASELEQLLQGDWTELISPDTRAPWLGLRVARDEVPA